MAELVEEVDFQKKSQRHVLIIDYNVVSTLLSGHSLLALLDNLDPNRYVATVVFNRACDAERATAQRGVRTITIQHGGGSLITRIWEYCLLPFKLWLVAMRVKPDIIHANNVMAARPAMMLRALTKIPVCVHIRNIGFWPKGRRAILRADTFACVSRATMLGTVPASLQRRAVIVHDGLDFSSYEPEREGNARFRASLALPSDAIVIGMAARLSRQKGQKDFIEVARRIALRLPTVVFIHVGGIPGNEANDGYERELIELSKAGCAAGNFRWLGYTQPICKFWSAVDVAVVPSCGPEALGRVVLEAMAMRKPVVATRSGGPEEIISDGLTGALVDMHDVGKLTDAVLRLAINLDERRRIGNAAREDVEKRFSAKAYAERMMKVYDETLSNRRLLISQETAEK